MVAPAQSAATGWTSGWELATVLVVAMLGAAAVYEAAVAAGWVALGTAPGSGPPGEGAVRAAAAAAAVAGAVVCSLLRRRRELRLPALLPLAAPAAAGFALARFYTFDPYYLPTLRRMSEGGVVATSWIVALAVIAVVVALLVRVWPRVGLPAMALFLFVSVGTALFESTGH